MRRRPKAVPRAVPRRPATDEIRSGDSGPDTLSRPAIDGDGVVTVDDANFLDVTAGSYTLVDFWAGWCAPCRTFGPVFADAAKAHNGPVRFGACNVDQNPKTAGLLGIRSIPALVVFDPDGNEVTRTGALPQARLEDLVGQLTARSTAGQSAE